MLTVIYVIIVQWIQLQRWVARQSSSLPPPTQSLSMWPHGPEAPQIALEVTGAVATLCAPCGVVRLIHHLDVGSLGSLVMGIQVADCDVHPPVTGVAAMKIFGALGFDEHHPIAMQEGRVVDAVRVILVEDPGFEAECVLKPRKRGFDIAIDEGRVDVHEPLILSDLFLRFQLPGPGRAVNLSNDRRTGRLAGRTLLFCLFTLGLARTHRGAAPVVLVLLLKMDHRPDAESADRYPRSNRVPTAEIRGPR